MSFSAPVFTNAGKALQMRSLAGETLTFTAIKLGDGQLTSQSAAELTSLINTIVSVPITSAKRTDKYFFVKGSFTNQALSAGFYWREIGVYAADPDHPDDRSKDILYCYQNAYNLAEYIASSGSEIIEKVIKINVFVGNAEQVSAVIDSSAIYLTQADLEGYAKKSDIPTKVGELDNDSGFITSPDGGNAAQLGGIPASELDRVRCAVVGGVKAGVQWAGIDATKGDTTIRMQVDADYDKMLLFKSTDGQKSWTGIALDADTVDGKHASELLQNLGYFNSGSLLNYALVEKTSGFVFVGSEVTGMPYDNTYWFVSIEHTTDHCKITATDINTSKTFIDVYNDALEKWSGWSNVADGGNATSVGGASLTTDAATIGLRCIASGTADATTANCPAGAWYGQYE